jgi:hypothetical protein
MYSNKNLNGKTGTPPQSPMAKNEISSSGVLKITLS